MAKDRSDDIYEVVTFIKDRMVTKNELRRELDPIKQDVSILKQDVSALKGKVDSIYNLIDNEVDKRKVLEVRTTKLEQKVLKA